MLQMFHFRNELLRDPVEYKSFENEYSAVLDNFMELKLALKNLRQLFEHHESEIKSGSAVRIHPNKQLSILKPIDNQYRAYVKDFFIKGEMVISAIPRVGQVFGLKAGFLFGPQKKFERESANLKKDWGQRAEFILAYVQAARSTWYETFNGFRNDIEHSSMTFPPLSYRLESDGTVAITFPTFPSGGILNVLESLEYSVLELVESCLLFFFSTKLRIGMLIKEIPPEQRDPNKVVRYRLYMRVGDQDVPFGGTI